MSKIVLDSVASGYNLSKINSNFQKIQTELNNKVLYRDNIDGEPNQLEDSIDANGKKIYNLGTPTNRGDAVPLGFIEDMAGGVLQVSDWKVDVFTGDGSSTQFILTDAPSSIEAIFISIDGLVAVPITDYYLINETTIVFTYTPYAGAEIVVRYGTFLGAGGESGLDFITPAPLELGAESLVKDGLNGIIRNIKAGTNITLTAGDNSVEINSVNAGEANTISSVGGATSIVAGKSGVDLQVKSLVAGDNISLSSGVNTVTINGPSPGEANTASNTAGGAGVFQGKTGVNLSFKSLKAGTNTTVTDDGTNITIATPIIGESNTLGNIGDGDVAGVSAGLAGGKLGVMLLAKTIKAGSNIAVNTSGNNVVISSTASGGTGTITGVQNVGGSGADALVSNVTSGVASIRKFVTTYPVAIGVNPLDSNTLKMNLTPGSPYQFMMTDAGGANIGWTTLYSSSTPSAPTVGGSAGGAATFSRSDHAHPSQTTVTGNAGTATTLQTARNISISGAVTGSASFNGSSDINIVTTSGSIIDTTANYIWSGNNTWNHSSTYHNKFLTGAETFNTGVAPTVKINKNIATSGGGVTSALLVESIALPGSTTFEWTGLFHLKNQSTYGDAVALYTQGYQHSGAGSTWAACFEAKEVTSGSPGSGLYGAEINCVKYGRGTGVIGFGIGFVFNTTHPSQTSYINYGTRYESGPRGGNTYDEGAAAKLVRGIAIDMSCTESAFSIGQGAEFTTTVPLVMDLETNATDNFLGFYSGNSFFTANSLGSYRGKIKIKIKDESGTEYFIPVYR